MKLLFSTLLALGTIVLLGGTASALPRDPASLYFFDDGSRAGGKSLLTRDASAGVVSSVINATHLERGAAYTFWYVVINAPENCSNGVCDEDDLFIDPETPNIPQIEAAQIAVLGGNGEIANRGGRAQFTGMLFEGTTAGLDVAIGPGGLIDAGPGMLMEGNVMTAEIHIVLRNHGPAQTGADLAEQLNTFWGNCNELPVDDDPQVTCVDEQFAVHLP